MRTWPAPEVPALPGPGVPLRLHDTASGGLTQLSDAGEARLYACGVTPYDATHLGHAATYLAWDLLCRVWRDNGRAVHYVQNVTDVDDPLIERAERDGEDWRALADREIDLFRSDMTALRVLPPREFVGAVEAIPEIVEFIDRLRAAGAAYEIDSDIYYSVAADPVFPSVSHYDAPTMLALAAERGGDPDRPGKKDPLDPLLWRAERPGEPAWDFPLGRGRPGWHVECTAIAVNRLGMGFDVQAGGTDLIFPHHEMSASHGRVGTGVSPYARAHVHAGMIGLDGEKMSKSRGNLVFVSGLRRDGVEPAAIRLALFAGHYRSDRPWTRGLLAEAQERLARWRAAVAADRAAPAEPVLTAVRERLSDDLDAPGALAAVDAWAARTLAGVAEGPHQPEGGRPAPGELVRCTVDALLGVAL